MENNRAARVTRAFIVGALLALAFPLSLAAMPPLTFDRALALAVARAPSLDARRSLVEAARQDAARADALPDPRLSVGIDNWPVQGSEAFSFKDDMMTMKRVGLMQEFPSRAKRDARRVLADQGIDRARLLQLAESLAVRESTARAWLSLWAAERELEQLQALREQSQLAVDTGTARLRAATANAAEVMAVQAAQLALENRLDSAQAQVEAANAQLAQWLGAIEVATTGEAPALDALPVAAARLLAAVDQQGPLLAWRARESVAEAEVALATATRRPDWSLAAAYGQRQGDRSDMLMLEWSMDLPLFTGNRQDRDVAARRAELQAVVSEREDARRQQRAQVNSLLAEWTGLKRQVARDREQLLPLVRDRSSTALAGYRGGGMLQPWLEARSDEIQARVDHARRLGELGRAWAALAYLVDHEEPLP